MIATIESPYFKTTWNEADASQASRARSAQQAQAQNVTGGDRSTTPPMPSAHGPGNAPPARHLGPQGSGGRVQAQPQRHPQARPQPHVCISPFPSCLPSLCSTMSLESRAKILSLIDRCLSVSQLPNRFRPSKSLQPSPRRSASSAPSASMISGKLHSRSIARLRRSHRGSLFTVRDRSI